MQAFLEKCAEKIMRDYPEETGNLCVVFPNRRAGLFFKKYLSRQISKPLWLPKVYGIEDFIVEIANVSLTDHLELVFDLYRAHRKIEKDGAQSFEKFLQWAHTLIADFNDIDENLVDAKSLFNELSETKAIKVWNLGEKPLTEFEQAYIRFFRSLYLYYKELTETLIEKKQAYRGMAYRLAAQAIENGYQDKEVHKYVFFGFNALNKAEEQIITRLIEKERAEIFWDADAYYLLKSGSEQNLQEAGKFLNRHFKKKVFRKPEWIEDNFKIKPKKIDIISTSGNINQVKVVGNLLQSARQHTEDFDHMSVVLADETLLIPLLNSIPENIGKFNVTMGLPLFLTPAYQLYDSLIRVGINASNLQQMRGTNKLKFYLSDIISVLKHPYILHYSEQLFGLSLEDFNLKTSNMIKSGKVFFEKEALKEMFPPKVDPDLLDLLFLDPEKKINHIPELLIKLNNILKNNFLNKDDEQAKHFLEIEYLFHLNNILNRIESMMARNQFLDKLSSLHEIFRHIVRTDVLAFYGEPLKGMQIMGMLETRTLDFEKVILLSANEDILPANRHRQSFIPFDIRSNHHLPTYKDNDAIYAYHFYRLISRAREITIIYNSEQDGLKSADKSRFISQILHELKRYNPDICIKEQTYNTQIPKESGAQQISVPKTEPIISKLGRKAEKGFSPSSLDTYRLCPLRFYFTYILEIPEPQKIEASADAPILGSIIHEALEIIYKPFEGKSVDTALLRKEKSNLREIAAIAFKKYFPGGETTYGKNYLLTEVINASLKKLIDQEIEEISKGAAIEIVELERYSYKEIVINGRQSIKLHGKADRIDRYNKQLRIVDYKTGSVSQQELKVNEWSDLLDEPGLSKAYQLLFYGWLCSEIFADQKDVSLGILSLRTPSAGLIKLRTPSNNYDDINNSFEEILVQQIEEIFNPKVAFRQTENQENCRHCTFKGICQRETI